MNKEEIIKLLLSTFEGSFINEEYEFIAHPRTNNFFQLQDVKTLLDVKCKIIEYCIRPIYKGSLNMWEKVEYKTAVEKILETNLDWLNLQHIYAFLGNAVNRELTIAFIQSDFDMKTIYDYKKKRGEKIHTHDEVVDLFNMYL